MNHKPPPLERPFNDDIHTSMAWFYERSLSKLAKRMGTLLLKFQEQLLQRAKSGSAN